jgi:hypothetical protein
VSAGKAGYQLAGVRGSVERVTELDKMGFNRVLLLLPPEDADTQWEKLEQLADLLRAAQ